MKNRAPGPALRRDPRRRRARRFAVRLQHVRRYERDELLRRLLGPSSWRCHPHASPHPEPGPQDD